MPKNLTKAAPLLKAVNWIFIILFSFLGVLFVGFGFSQRDMASYIMSLLFLLPAIILIYNNYIISHRLEGFERYFCNYCEDYFYAHKPRSKNKDDVHCSDCGTKLNTPENFIKGRKFEQKVKERFERSEGFKVVSETPRYEDKNTHAKKYPDLRVQFFNKDKFFVEVKYRSHLSSRNLADIITKDTQLKRFKDYKEDTGEEVYYFLGIGGKPEDPKEVFVIPVNHLIFHLKNNRDLDYLREKHYDIDLKRNAYYKIDKEKDRKILR